MSEPGREGHALTAFYRGTGTDGAGRRLEEILAWDDQRLEYHHDFIQWLFPLYERSRFNPSAPVLDPETAREFRNDPELQEKLLRALDRMLAFYGLERRVTPPAGVSIVVGPNFGERAANWMNPGNHNHLRLSRIMKSLSALGRKKEATALKRCLLGLARSRPEAFDPRTMVFWRFAV